MNHDTPGLHSPWVQVNHDQAGFYSPWVQVNHDQAGLPSPWIQIRRDERRLARGGEGAVHAVVGGRDGVDGAVHHHAGNAGHQQDVTGLLAELGPTGYEVRVLFDDAVI